MWRTAKQNAREDFTTAFLVAVVLNRVRIKPETIMEHFEDATDGESRHKREYPLAVSKGGEGGSVEKDYASICPGGRLRHHAFPASTTTSGYFGSVMFLVPSV
jgi:hypothetical protein